MGNDLVLSERKDKPKLALARTRLKKYWAELRIKQEKELTKYIHEILDLYENSGGGYLTQEEALEYVTDMLELLGIRERLCAKIKPKGMDDETFMQEFVTLLFQELKLDELETISYKEIIRPNGEGFRKFLLAVLQIDTRNTTDDVKKYYTIKDKVGSGGYAVVFKGVHEATGLPVALKEINKGNYQNTALKHLQREISISKDIDHPSIIKVFEVFESPTHFYLVMELANQDLISLLQTQEYYTEKRAKEIISQVASALDYLHSRGIAHRDLKPENILISYIDPYVVKLTDFGFAKSFQESFLKTKVGTSFYLAPEIISSSNYTEAADMWSLGVVLYVLLSGTFPFFGDNLEEIVTSIMELNYDFEDDCWEHISPKAKQLIEKLLVDDPQKRLTAKQCLADEWFKEETDEEVHLSETKKRLSVYSGGAM